jgi:hypothetical protein
MDSPSSNSSKRQQLAGEDQRMATWSPGLEEAEKYLLGPKIKKQERILESFVTTVWNHSLAVGSLQASFEICRLYLLFTIKKLGANSNLHIS